MKKLAIFAFVAGILAITYIITPSATLFELAVATERKIAGLTPKTLTTSEGQVAYLEGGTGETLLLLHGFGANKDNWTRLAMHLSNDFHIIAIDLPGFGESYKTDSLNYDVSSQVKRLNEIVDALNLTEFHLAGNSMGGYIAGNFAAAFPEKLNSLWLIAPLGVASAPKSEMFEVIEKQQRPVVLVKDEADYERLITHVFHEPPFIPQVLVTELAKQAVQNFPLHSKIYQDTHKLPNQQIGFISPLDTVLKSLQIPVLITWGDKDRILHPGGAKILSVVIPNATLHMMENIGHLPMVESPSQTAKAFMTFHRNE